MTKQKIILVGGGGHCKSCIDVIEQLGEYEIAGILDIAEKAGSGILDKKVIGIDDDLARLKKEVRYFLITVGQIGSAGLRIRLFNLLDRHNVELPVIVSPHAYVSPHAQLGHGTIVMHGAVINAGAKIGDNCIINSKALVEHDAAVGDHCHISTGAIINGGAVIGGGTFFGSGAVCVQGVSVPPDSFIKANSLIK